MDERKFRELLERYGDTVLRLAVNQTRSYADAQDITQEVFLQLFSSKREFQSDEHIKAWLLRAALNLCKTLFRSAAHRRNVSIEELTAELSDGFDGFTAAEEARDVYTAVMTLPQKYRAVIHLFYYEDETIEQISETTGIRVGTVKSLLSRGRAMLKEKIKS